MADSSDRRRARAWATRLARSRHALPALGGVSFLETLVLPVPIELVMVPWMLMEPRRKWWLATVVLAGCLVGALVGYATGWWLFDSAGRWLLAMHGGEAAYERFAGWFEAWGFWAIVAVGVLPVPFQAAMLVAGVAAYPLWLYLPATLLGRGVRYYGVALLVTLAGRHAVDLWERRRRLVLALLTAVIVVAALLSRRLVT